MLRARGITASYILIIIVFCLDNCSVLFYINLHFNNINSSMTDIKQQGTKKIKHLISYLIIYLTSIFWSFTAYAQSSIPNQQNFASSAATGPGSVDTTLSEEFTTESQRAAARKGGFYDKYLDFKKSITEQSGFEFGFDYNALILSATSSLGEKTGASGVFRAFGEWNLVGKKSEKQNYGSLIYKFENRHKYNTQITPKELGAEVGYIGLPAITFSNKQWLLTNLYWIENFLNNRLEIIAGVVDSTDYIDLYSFTDNWTAFNNFAFATNPTIPAPDQGFGAALRFLLTNNIYLLGGVADTNGDPNRPEKFYTSFFHDSELFSHFEAGWISSWDKRFNDNIHLISWYADSRSKVQIPYGWGWAFSANKLLAEQWEPFFRLGYAKKGGVLWDETAMVGIGYYLNKNDTSGKILNFGLDWSRPSRDLFPDTLRDQYTAEIYYRFRVLKVLLITPAVQFLFNPALNPDKNLITIFGLRGRLSL